MAKLVTTESFVARATTLHGGKYSYPSTVYVSATQKVEITCPRHGIFMQTPNDHTNGKGCPKCGVRKPATSLKTFLEKARSIHGGKYAYESVQYTDASTKVEIGCPLHGPFMQVPTKHLEGQGCPKCKGQRISESKSLTTLEFIERARAVHGDRYDYQQTKVKGVTAKVEILCRVHGSFWQVADSHLRGHGCAKCGRLQGASKHRAQDVVLKARAVHGDRYEYSSDFVYKKSSQKMPIFCKTHGWFKQSVWLHIRGQGCAKCGKIRLAEKLRMSPATFVERARKRHGEHAYDYSKVNFVNTATHVVLGCTAHAPTFWFKVTPNKHLHGSGCPRCANSEPVTFDTFLARLKAAGKGDSIDFSKSVYKGYTKPIEVYCTKHGISWVTKPVYILTNNGGCRKCGYERVSKAKTLDWDEAVRRARQIHGDRYAYPKPDSYTGLRQYVAVTCKKHGDFEVTLDNHLHAESGCPRCAVQVSAAQEEIFKRVKQLHADAVLNTRSVIKPFELDVYIPSLNIGIEYNGMRWHSCVPGDPPELTKRDRNKWELCKAKGIQLLIIWESDWQSKPDVIWHWLEHKLGAAPKLCGARETEFGTPTFREAKTFYNRYHLQGVPAPASHTLGLRYKGNWVALISFSTSIERNVALPDGEFYFSRLALAGNVPGASSKLFRQMVAQTAATKVHAHSDNSYADGDVKAMLGFKVQEELEPRYRVWHPDYGLRHRTFWQKSRIEKRIAELGLPLPEKPLTTFGYHRYCGARHVWDCGRTRWIWTSP